MIANALTLARLLLALPFAWSLSDPERAPLSALLLTIGIATDYADGVVARRTGTASAAGRLFDHGSDFLFVVLGISALALRSEVPWLLPVLIAIAFAQYVIDSLVIQRRRELRPNPLGRWNGILYFVVPILDITANLALPALAATLYPFAWLLCATTLASITSRLLALRN